MDVMRTGCSMLGNLEPEGDFSNQNETADRILASMASIILTGIDTHTRVLKLRLRQIMPLLVVNFFLYLQAENLQKSILEL